jgi:hypothetical protein
VPVKFFARSSDSDATCDFGAVDNDLNEVQGSGPNGVGSGNFTNDPPHDEKITFDIDATGITKGTTGASTSIVVSSMTADTELRIRVDRVNDSGCGVTFGGVGSIRTTTGTYTQSVSTGWAAGSGERLRYAVLGARVTGEHGNKNFTIDCEDADTFCEMTGWTSGVTHEAVASPAGAGTVDAEAAVAKDAIASPAGAGTVDAEAAVEKAATASPSGAGTVDAEAAVEKAATASPAGSGNVDAAALMDWGASASPAGDGNVDAFAAVEKAATASPAGAGSVVALGGLEVTAAASPAGAGNVDALAAVEKAATASPAGSGSVAGNAIVDWAAVASPAGAGSVVAFAAVEKAATASPAGAGTVVADATVSTAVLGTATISGAGSVVALGGLSIEAVASPAGAGLVTAQAAVERLATAALLGEGFVQAAGQDLDLAFATFRCSGRIQAVSTGGVPVRRLEGFTVEPTLRPVTEPVPVDEQSRVVRPMKQFTDEDHRKETLLNEVVEAIHHLMGVEMIIETPNIADTEFEVGHKLRKVPTSFEVQNIQVVGQLFASRQAEWTDRKIFLTFTGGSDKLRIRLR